MSKEIALRAALENRLKFGKADESAVLGKLMQLVPEMRSNRTSAQKLAAEAVRQANEMDEATAKAKCDSLPELGLQPKEQKFLEIPNVVDNPVFRFEPSPSGPMHIGHTYPFLLNNALAKKYHGKLILRISDTNPENIDPQAYELLPDDGKWLSEGLVKEYYVQSDRMQIYYNYAEEALQKGYAYVCSCSSETFKELVDKSLPCKCRSLSPAENLARWKEMLDDAPQGKYVVRVKTDLKHPNPAMRDWPALRINESEHPRQGKKYRVWPLLNWAVAIDDHEMGVTHTLRAKDHMDNAKRQKLLLDHFGWTDPTHLYVGRIHFADFRLSASGTRKKIEAGEYSGWDDIRLPFIRALKRRGYQPGAFQRYAESMGISETDKSVAIEEYFKALNSFNKDIIDPVAKRCFFVIDPVEVQIHGCPTLNPKVPVHPSYPDMGFREFRVGSKFLLAKEDFDALEDGKIYRLMECLNFFKKGDSFEFHSLEYEKFKGHGEKIMHWLPVSRDLVDVKLFMPDNSVVEGKAEKSVSKVKEGEIVQFERVGFSRCDNAETHQFWFAHR
jgi:glutamyl-tRNA synthetase